MCGVFVKDISKELERGETKRKMETNETERKMETAEDKYDLFIEISHLEDSSSSCSEPILPKSNTLPARCFFLLFQKYHAPANAFYLMLLKKETKDCWFSNVPLGKNKLSKAIATLCVQNVVFKVIKRITL